MPPPRALYYIEWTAASPLFQHTKRRTFRSEEHAARQLASLLFPPDGTRVVIHDVSVTCGWDETGLRWERLYGPAYLQPAAPSEELDSAAA